MQETTFAEIRFAASVVFGIPLSVRSLNLLIHRQIARAAGATIRRLPAPAWAGADDLAVREGRANARAGAPGMRRNGGLVTLF